jgi:hypothetical protein
MPRAASGHRGCRISPRMPARWMVSLRTLAQLLRESKDHDNDHNEASNCASYPARWPTNAGFTVRQGEGTGRAGSRRHGQRKRRRTSATTCAILAPLNILNIVRKAWPKLKHTNQLAFLQSPRKPARFCKSLVMVPESRGRRFCNFSNDPLTPLARLLEFLLQSHCKRRRLGKRFKQGFRFAILSGAIHVQVDGRLHR